MNDWLNAVLVKGKRRYGVVRYDDGSVVVHAAGSRRFRGGDRRYSLMVWVVGAGYIFDRAVWSSFRTPEDVRLCEVVKALLDGMPIGAALDLLMEVLPEDNTLCVAMAKILGV